MRKLLALLLVVILVFPLTMATLSVISVSTWVLDRNFYTDLLGNERLYEVLLAEDLPNYFNRRVVREVDSVPAQALSAALREVVTPQYMRDEATRIVNEAFDVIEGRSDALDIYLDVTPIKAALRGEGGTRFARTLAANLPTCAEGQESTVPGGTLLRCLPASVSTEEAATIIGAALPLYLDKVPDQIDLTGERINLRRDLRGVNFMMTGQDALNMAIVVLVFIAGSFWFVAALIGGEDRRERLMWLGWSLLIPAILVFLIGLPIHSDLTTGWVRFGLNEARLDGFEYSLEFRQALIEVSRTALNTIANGFLMAGGVAGAIAIALIVWGGSTPSEKRYAPMMAAPMTTAQPQQQPPAQPPNEPPSGSV